MTSLTYKMNASQINTMINNIDSVQIKINSATGAAVMVELRMRLIGELCARVRERLKDSITSKKEPNQYWNCKLSFLDDAVDIVFQEVLNLSQRQQLSEFRNLRNKLLHGNFVGLMELMGITPGSRLIEKDGSRALLQPTEIKEAVLSIDRQNGFAIVETKAKNVIAILDEILLSLAN